MKIVVLAGGLSPERDVSLTSGSLIANALMAAGHEVIMTDIYEGIVEDPQNIVFHCKEKGHRYEYEVASSAPDLSSLVDKNNGRRELIGPGVMDLCRRADVVFIALHGAMGENGQLQAVFDCFDICYTGSDYCGSLLAMDKDLSKKLMVHSGVPTAKWLLVDATDESVDRVDEAIGFPCFIKPVHCGSSVGVSLVESKDQWSDAIILAAQYESQIMAERRMVGREFSVGILDGKALPVIEIIPRQGFYNYENKYQKGLAEEVCPADLNEEQNDRISEYALKVHRLLRLGSYARIDFILDRDGQFYCLEANTLPGMTPTSLLPQEAAAVGIDYQTLCDKIVHMALRDKKD